MTLFDTGIIPTINDHLQKESEKVRDYGDYWSASSAGYCMRKNIFERLGVPPVAEDARKQRVFSSGHIFHEWIQGITQNAGLSVAQEIELQDEDLMIRGHFDDLVLVDDAPVGKLGKRTHLILYDYKTAHSRWFEYAKDRPMSHYHKMQLGTYMYMLRKGQKVPTEKNGLKLPLLSSLIEARILKISKDDLRLHEQQLLWSDELAKEVIDYWLELNRYWLDKKLPPCTCANYEINKKTGLGFMADPRYNPFFYKDEPCSIEWYQLKKEEGLLK